MQKKTFIIVFTLLFLLTINNLSSRAGEDASSTGLSFLKIGAGARAVGMGEAFTAIASDPSAAYWNPAGLAQISSANLMFTHNKWLQDINNEFAAVNFHIGKNAFGVSLISNNVDGIERRVGPTIDPLGEVSAHGVMFGVSYARHLQDNFAMGVTAKFLYEKIYVEESSGFAFDLGVIYHSPVKGLRAGLALQNFGYMTELKEESSKLPQTARIGIAYLAPFQLLQGEVTLAADVVQIFESTSHLNLGMEYNFRSLFALRFGYQTGYDDKGIHAGFGVELGRYQLNYAYVPFSSDLGSSHRISVGIRL